MPRTHPEAKPTKATSPKRRDIMAAAVDLFSTKPFHEVLLDEVAEAAGTSKGTIYTYFESKEHLFGSLIQEGLRNCAAEVEAQTQRQGASAAEALCRIIKTLVVFAIAHPGLSRLLKSQPPPDLEAGLAREREALSQSIQRVIRRGIRAGELQDSKPAWTAQYIPAMIAEVVSEGVPNAEALTKHITSIVMDGLRVR